MKKPTPKTEADKPDTSKAEAAPPKERPTPAKVVALQPNDPKRFDKPIAEKKAGIASLQREIDETTEKLTADPLNEALHKNLSSAERELVELRATLARLLKLRENDAASWELDRRHEYAGSLLEMVAEGDKLIEQLRTKKAARKAEAAKLAPLDADIEADERRVAGLFFQVLKAGKLVDWDDDRRIRAILNDADSRMQQKFRGRLFNAVRRAAASLNVPNPVPPVERVVVELVAVKDGSLANDARRILRGTKFKYDVTPDFPGGPQKLPPVEFALPVGSPEANALLKRGLGDTRPPDAIANARNKMAGLGPVAGESP